jgi:surface protein
MKQEQSSRKRRPVDGVNVPGKMSNPLRTKHEEIKEEQEDDRPEDRPSLQDLLGKSGVLETMLSFMDTPRAAMMRRVNKRWKKCAEIALEQQTKKAFTSNMELRNAVRHYCGMKSVREDEWGRYRCGCHISDTCSVIFTYGPIIGKWNVSKVTDFSHVFSRMTDFNEHIEEWDVSRATNMQYMFSGAHSFNQSLAKWDTSNVTNMHSTFCHATRFNQCLANWDTSKVTDMSEMFYHASYFNQPLASWNTGKVTNMTEMFKDANSFNQPLATWDTSNVRHMRSMFVYNTSFNQTLEGWDVSQVIDMRFMFGACSYILRLYDNNPDLLETAWGWNLSKLQHEEDIIFLI